MQQEQGLVDQICDLQVFADTKPVTAVQNRKNADGEQHVTLEPPIGHRHRELKVAAVELVQEP